MIFDFQTISEELLFLQEKDVFQLLSKNADEFTRSDYGEGCYSYESKENMVSLYGQNAHLYMEFNSEGEMYACFWRCYYGPDESELAYGTACQIIAEYDNLYEAEPLAVPDQTFRGQYADYNEFFKNLLPPPSINTYGTYWKDINGIFRDLKMIVNKEEGAVLSVGYGEVAGFNISEGVYMKIRRGCL